jgi:hypothetical protein
MTSKKEGGREGAKGKIVILAADRRREKLSDRIYRIVQDLFFSRKALMKNM